MYKAFLLIGVAAVFVAGCKSSEGSETAATTPPAGTPPLPAGAPPAPGYAGVQVFFNTTCAGCHGASNGKAGISLTSYDAVMKGGKEGPIVKPGDPENSLLVQALRGTHGAKQMPPRTPAPEDRIKAVEDWIKDGAKKA